MLDTREMWKNVHRVFWLTDVTPAVVISALTSLLWSLMLFFPGNTFDRPMYANMARVMSEEVWATLFLAFGLVRCYHLLVGRVGRTTLWYQIFNGCAAFFWAYVAITVTFSVYPPVAAAAGTDVVAIASLWVFLRSGTKPVKLKSGVDRRVKQRS